MGIVEENQQTSYSNEKANSDSSAPPPDYNSAVSSPYSQPPPSAINHQPTPANNVPVRAANCPPGLEYLTQVDQLLIKQQINPHLGNSFVIKNPLGQNIYWATEDADCCATCFCGTRRPFDMRILDNRQIEVLHLYRPVAIGFTDSIEVSAPGGYILGRIEQEFTLVYPNFNVKNHVNQTVLRIVGPAVQMGFGDVVFKVRTMDDREVGRISKQWSGLARELFTDADFFGISFPVDLDVRIKAVMLGACMLINQMYFERN